MFYLVNWTISLQFSVQETLFFGALISATDPGRSYARAKASQSPPYSDCSVHLQ